MAKSTKTDKLTVPGVLSFERKLSPSDARLYSTDWERRGDADPEPLRVIEKSVRGTIANRLKKGKGDDALKLDAEMEKPNLQTVDVCSLPEQHDTLVCRFTLKVLSGLDEPSACNSHEFREVLSRQIQEYLQSTDATELSRRYATNLANGRFLWRNRVGAENIEVVIRQTVGTETKVWTFDAHEFSLRDFAHDNGDVGEIGDRIARAIRGDDEYALLDVTAYVRVGGGQEVFPSQELMQDAPSGKGAKSKYLFSVDSVAAMHSQKIGNAIRTIDTWYADDARRPIAVESYGSVTTEGMAYRNGTKDYADHFYKLFDKWSIGEDIDADQTHYVVAMLIRGGVFGKSEKES